MQIDAQLLAAIKRDQSTLDVLLHEVNGHWSYEDGLYRFYHQSFKVYALQTMTLRIVDALRALMPNRPMNAWFTEIVRSGTGKEFSTDHNARWLVETRPIVEAFLHAKYFLEMACKYGRELDTPPTALPSGWASVLHLFDAR